MRMLSISTIVLMVLSIPSTLAVPLIFDQFEYAVNNNTPTDCSNFLAHGWTGFKTNNCAINPAPGSYQGNGNIYTTNSIPGFSGQFPGGGSRVLAIEALPVFYQGQTDFYIQYGGPNDPIGHIPPDHWVQFWIYSEHTETHPSYFQSQSKFLYYNRATYYPATIGNDGYIMMVGLHHDSSAPLFADPCPAFPSHEFICDRGFFSSLWESLGEPTPGHGYVNNHIQDVNSHLGANLVNTPHVLPNAWTLVKIHIDITGTDPRAAPGQGVYEVWIKRPGDTNWTKTTEHIGGVTVINGQVLDLFPRFTDGFRTVRIPTTVGSSTYPQDTRDNTRNYWIYLDDFIMATEESDLPAYGSAPVPDTIPPARSNGAPAGSLAAGTTQVTITLSTNEAATCRLSIAPNTQYSSMMNFVTTGNTVHSSPVSGLQNGQTYSYYVRCQDSAGNTNTNDYTISFSVAAPDNIAPSQVTGLTATAASSQINLVWQAATDNIGVAGYRIYRNSINIANATATAYSSTNLLANTTYSFTVAAYDAAGNLGPQSSSSIATTLPNQAAAGTIYLSDLNWTALQGTPAVRDFNHIGGPLNLSGTVYPKGIGTHSPNNLTFIVPTGCVYFVSDIGIDDMNGENGNAEFRVYLDGVQAYASGAITGLTPTRRINLSLGSASTLRLELDPLGSITRDAGNWANARFICGQAQSTIPGDINSDRVVNVLDIQAIVAHFGKTTGYPSDVDVASPGMIDLFDVMVVVRNWGRSG